jgi:hypothetical protein
MRIFFLVESTIGGATISSQKQNPLFYASKTAFSITEKTVDETPAVFVQQINSTKGGRTMVYRIRIADRLLDKQHKRVFQALIIERTQS